MLITHPDISHKDHRGVICDLIAEDIDSVTYLTIKANAVRGNHYHEHTDQWLYVISGSLIAKSCRQDNFSETQVIKAGDLVENRAMEQHAFQAIEDSCLMAFAKGPRQATNYENDTVRLDIPLL